MNITQLIEDLRKVADDHWWLDDIGCEAADILERVAALPDDFESQAAQLRADVSGKPKTHKTGSLIAAQAYEQCAKQTSKALAESPKIARQPHKELK